jgi:hypothetical protein
MNFRLLDGIVRAGRIVLMKKPLSVKDFYFSCCISMRTIASSSFYIFIDMHVNIYIDIRGCVLLIISRPRYLSPNSLNEDLVSILIIRNRLVNYMFYEISTQRSTFNGIKILRGVYKHCLFYIVKTEDW